MKLSKTSSPLAGLFDSLEDVLAWVKDLGGVGFVPPS